MSTWLPCRFWKFGLYYMKWQEARFPSNSKRLPIPLERGTVSSTSEKLLNFITSVLVGSINLYSLVGWVFSGNFSEHGSMVLDVLGLEIDLENFWFHYLVGVSSIRKTSVFLFPAHNITPGPGRWFRLGRHSSSLQRWVPTERTWCSLAIWKFDVSSRELRYSTFGKGTSPSNIAFFRWYVRSPGGDFLGVWFLFFGRGGESDPGLEDLYFELAEQWPSCGFWNDISRNIIKFPLDVSESQ